MISVEDKKKEDKARQSYLKVCPNGSFYGEQHFVRYDIFTRFVLTGVFI